MIAIRNLLTIPIAALLVLTLFMATANAESEDETAAQDPPEVILEYVESTACVLLTAICPQAYLGGWVFDPVRLYTICDPVSGNLVEIVQGYRWVYVGYYDSDSEWNEITSTNILYVGTEGTGTSCT